VRIIRTSFRYTRSSFLPSPFPPVFETCIFFYASFFQLFFCRKNHQILYFAGKQNVSYINNSNVFFRNNSVVYTHSSDATTGISGRSRFVIYKESYPYFFAKHFLYYLHFTCVCVCVCVCIIFPSPYININMYCSRFWYYIIFGTIFRHVHFEFHEQILLLLLLFGER